MPLLAIPNISVGTPGESLRAATTAVVETGARLLDLHSDSIHNRSVLTVTADEHALIEAMVSLAGACKTIDLSSHVGVHPRVGALDVCPFVAHNAPIDTAIAAAHRVGVAIAKETNAPVFFYGAASSRRETKELPDIRRGSLEGLLRRMDEGLVPDEGPAQIDPRFGAVLVGARGPLIAFNVWLEADLQIVRAIASDVRQPGRVRSLGLEMGAGRSQVSMNLTSPDEIGIEDVFEHVCRSAVRAGARIVGTEIVGLVEDRYLPQPDAKVTRLLIEPGHSLESALND